MAAIMKVDEGANERAKAGIVEDPMVEVEAEVKECLVMATRDILLRLTDALNGERAPRVLRLGESVSKAVRTLLAEIDGSPAASRRLKGMYSPPGVEGLESGELTEYAGSNLETFGAQFIQQLGSSIKHLTGDTNTSSSSSTLDGLQVNSLMSAIETAKRMKDGDLESKLRTKLDSILEVSVKETLDDRGHLAPPEMGLLPPAASLIITPDEEA